MGTRLELHEVLCGVVNASEPDGDRHTYYSPPESLKIKYPCVVYNLSAMDSMFADNIPYLNFNGYEVTVIDKDPDSIIRDKIKKLPMCIFNRHFVSDNLNHWVFTLYY